MNQIAPILLVVCLVSLGGCIGPDTDTETNVTNTTQATVVSVVDGDTITVRRQSQEETVRLFGVDTPETSTDQTETAEYGVPGTEDGKRCLSDTAAEATRFAERTLKGEQVQLRKPTGENRGDFGRLLRYVIVEDNQTFGEQLLSRGLARVYDNKGDFPKQVAYTRTETGAQSELSGLWGCSAVSEAGVAIFEVRADSLGSDTATPTEFVEIGNTNNQPISLANTTITDRQGHTYEIDRRTLAPHSTVAVHTCETTDSDDMVWNRCSGVWNNGGDTVRIHKTGSNPVRLLYE